MFYMKKGIPFYYTLLDEMADGKCITILVMRGNFFRF